MGFQQEINTEAYLFQQDHKGLHPRSLVNPKHTSEVTDKKLLDTTP